MKGKTSSGAVESVKLTSLTDDDGLNFWYRLSLYVSGRVFIVTENSRLGLAPWTTFPGDRIWVIRGMSVPVIVRPDEGRQVLLGESYVHGLMEGQALEMVSSGILADEELIIR